jgi:hypothetical protein
LHRLTLAPRRCARSFNTDMTAHTQDGFGSPHHESLDATQIATAMARVKASDARRKMNSLAILPFDEISTVAGVPVCPTNKLTPSHLCRYRTIAQRLLEPLNGWVIAIFWRSRSTLLSSGNLRRSIGVARMSHEHIAWTGPPQRSGYCRFRRRSVNNCQQYVHITPGRWIVFDGSKGRVLASCRSALGAKNWRA